MASQSLYRKWRSQTFGDLVGQEPVIRTLKNALTTGALAHAYLFAGPRGTGKTSTARLLAKTINCLQPRDGEPCNVCVQCQEITAGTSFNVIEIDAASNRGIDSIRELREKVMVPPTSGKYKVYILDEAHMLTTEAFNALLKTLEEPPPHAIFVMATTDVHKMLPTVLSRCQRFDFKRITTSQIVEHLRFIAEQEQVQLDQGAAELIARSAAGGMRDALSLLDQAIAYSGKQISLAQVQTMLGVADPRAILKFITHVSNLDSAAGLHLINELAEAGADLRQVNIQITDYWRSMMLAKAGADIVAILDSTTDEINEIRQIAQGFALSELTECARIFAQNDLMQKSQGTPQLGLELALLASIEVHRRGGAAAPATAPTAPVVRPTAAPSPERARLAAPVATPPPVPPRPEPRVAPVPVANPIPVAQPPAENPVVTPPPAVPAASVAATEPDEASDDLPDWDNVAYTEDIEDEEEAVLEPAPAVFVPAVPEPATPIHAEVSVPEEVNSAEALTIQQVKERWEYVKRRVKTRRDGAKIAALLNGYTIEQVDNSGGVPIVMLRAGANFHYSSLQKDEHQEAIAWAMKIELEQECRIRLLPPGSGGHGGSAPIIPPPASPPAGRNGDHRAENTMMASSYAPHRETSAPASAVAVAPPARKVPPSTAKSVQSDRALARNGTVSENTTMSARENHETRQQTVEKKAKSDPVVKEVIRLFKAELKDIQLK